MDKNTMFSYVDYTLLKPTSTWQQIQKLCDEALKYGTASVCIPPCYIGRAHKKYGAPLNICTVIGFPLGYSATEAKVLETKLLQLRRHVSALRSVMAI